LFRFREAEDDCTEALNLDDRYIKAYSRRATARKELGKLKESIEGVLTQTYMLVFSEYLVLDSFWYSFLMTLWFNVYSLPQILNLLWSWNLITRKSRNSMLKSNLCMRRQVTILCWYSGCCISSIQFSVTIAINFHRKFSRKHLALSEALYKEHNKEEGQKQV
jgi:hypothetical protein